MRVLPLAFLAGLSLAAPGQLVRQANSTLTLPANLPSATGYTTQNALGSLTFTAPIDVASPPGVTNRLFVLERGTGIQIVNLDAMTKSTFMPLAAYTNSECGLLSMAFHPNYNQNGYFYLFYSLRISSLTYQRVARFQATGTAGNYNAATTALASTVSPLITQRDEQDNHNGGDMAFGPDGYLYISVGDEGAQFDGSDNARRIAKDFLGHILRIDVDSKPGSLRAESARREQHGDGGRQRDHRGQLPHPARQSLRRARGRQRQCDLQRLHFPQERDPHGDLFQRLSQSVADEFRSAHRPALCRRRRAGLLRGGESSSRAASRPAGAGARASTRTRRRWRPRHRPRTGRRTTRSTNTITTTTAAAAATTRSSTAPRSPAAWSIAVTGFRNSSGSISSATTTPASSSRSRRGAGGAWTGVRLATRREHFRLGLRSAQ